MAVVDLLRVQAPLVYIYRHPVVRHLLFRFDAAAQGRQFVRELLPRVTFAQDGAGDPGKCALNLAFSFAGLTALERPEREARQCFPAEFREPPGPETTAPEPWWNGVPQSELHCLVSLWGPPPEPDGSPLASLTQEILDAARRFHLTSLAVRRTGNLIEGRRLPGGPRQVHFGYNDGFSMPPVQWADPMREGNVNFRHFLLGYATPEFPSAPHALPGAPPAADEAVDFVRDGSYLAFRLMYQNVAAFNDFLEINARRLAGTLQKTPEETAEWLAAKLLGRWRNGKPLLLAPQGPDQPVADEQMNAFDYTADSQGQGCPVSAHVRVVNPRRQPIFAPHQPVPVLLRRGMPYGEPLEGTTDDGRDRGLIGMFFCASLSRQFEKVLDWIGRNDFSPVFTDLRAQDPIAGDRGQPLASAVFRIPEASAPGGHLEAVGLKTFVETRGNAYLLMPGRSGLERLAAP